MFRSESESEKPLEGTSRSESSINASPTRSVPWQTLLSSPCCSALLLGAGRTSAGSCLLDTAFCLAEKREGATVQEKGQPSTGAREAPGYLQQSALLRSSGRRHQVAIVPWGCCELSSPRFCGSTRLEGASPAEVPAPLGGALRVTHSHPNPAPPQLQRLFPGSPFLPTSSGRHSLRTSPPPSRFRAPHSPTPAPRPGLSTTSLHSWRPHVFEGLPARFDVVSRSDLQARPRHHQTGPPHTLSHRAPRRCRVRRLPLSHPQRPSRVQRQPRAPRLQPCHPSATAGAAVQTWSSWGPGGRCGRCRQPSRSSRRWRWRWRRLARWQPPPACPRCPARPLDCVLLIPIFWAGPRAPARGPDGSPGWDSGHLELMSNWGSTETGSEVRREKRAGGDPAGGDGVV